MTSFSLVSIDAWREPEGGWTWNAGFIIDRDIYFEEKDITPRKILKKLRKLDFLTEYSKGRVRVDMHEEICDRYLIEILDKGTYEPLLALMGREE